MHFSGRGICAAAGMRGLLDGLSFSNGPELRLTLCLQTLNDAVGQAMENGAHVDAAHVLLSVEAAALKAAHHHFQALRENGTSVDWRQWVRARARAASARGSTTMITLLLNAVASDRWAMSGGWKDAFAADINRTTVDLFSGRLAIEGWTDSSALNGEAGASWGGGCMGVAGSRLIAWKCHAPKKPSDSSGAAKLVSATFLNKYMQGTRITTKELRLRADAPWPFNLDASSALNGAAMERVSDRMRYMAARYAMLWYAEDVTQDIKLLKCDTKDNVADGFTKSLQGADLERSRAQMLGSNV